MIRKKTLSLSSGIPGIAILTLAMLLATSAYAQESPSAPTATSESNSTDSKSTGEKTFGGYGAAELGEATFQIDPATRSLIVITDDATNEAIGEVIRKLDQPAQQVLIKVLFLEVTHSDETDIGLEAKMTDTDADMEQTLQSIFGLSSETEGAFYTIARDKFDMTVRALESVGKLEVLSRPSILTRNNETATITLGEEVPLITSSRIDDNNNTINTVEYQDVGIILEVTPSITGDGLVHMKVAPEISSLSGDTVAISNTVDIPVIAKRAAETNVIVPSGMTVVIGGMMEDSNTETIKKIPVLGDIPWIGGVFRRTDKTKSKTELLIFLTPQVVNNTGNLKEMATRESHNTQIASNAFSKQQLDQHLDGDESLIEAVKKPDEQPNVFMRFFRWFGKSAMRFE
jgi:general secretion pathway protein D